MAGDRLTLNETAERLGVSRRAVQAMVDRGQLPAQRLGHQWTVQPAALRLVERTRRRRPGRPLSQRAAWRIAADMSGAIAAGQPLDDLRRRLWTRAAHVDGYVHPSQIDELVEDSRVVWGGALALGPIPAGSDIDVYLRSSHLEAFRARYAIVEPYESDADTANVHLHVVDDDTWPFAEDQPRVTPWVAWLDLADRGDRDADLLLDQLYGRRRG